MLDLGLRGTELVLFAVLNGYSQEGDGCYYGTRRTLANRCGVNSLGTIDTALRSLMEKGLVRRISVHLNGQDLVAYTIPKNFVYPIQNLNTPTQNLDTPYPKIEQGGCPKIGYMNNKDIDNKKNIFIPPTPKEVADYSRTRGFVDPEGFASHFIDYYTQTKWHLANGKPMQDWRRAVITWEPNNKFRQFGKPTPRPLPANNSLDYDFTKDY